MAKNIKKKLPKNAKLQKNGRIKNFRSKKRNVGVILNFGLKFWVKIFSLKNKKMGQILRFWPKIQILG